MLYLVATPIGNMKDITARAIEVLRDCHFIIAENPAVSGKLLQLLQLPKKEMVQFAEHNERKILSSLVDRLKDQTACMISDAGTPGISDPGFRLVRACREEGITVSPIPGASAAIAALSVSGLPTDRFLFVGFLQKTEAKVLSSLNSAKNTESTLVAYDSPQRILKTLGFIKNNHPEAKVVVAREVTKIHEEFLSGQAAELIETLQSRPAIKGEITLMVSFK